MSSSDLAENEALPGVERASGSKERRERLTQIQKEARSHYLGDCAAICLSAPTITQYHQMIGVLTRELGFELRAEGRFSQNQKNDDAPYAILRHRSQHYVVHAEQFPSPTVLYAAESLNARKRLLLHNGISYSNIVKRNAVSEARSVCGIEFLTPGNLRVVVGAINSSSSQGTKKDPQERICPHNIAKTVHQSVMNPTEDLLLSSQLDMRDSQRTHPQQVSQVLGDSLGIVIPIKRPAPLVEKDECDYGDAKIEDDEILEAEMDIAQGMTHLETTLQQEIENDETTIPLWFSRQATNRQDESSEVYKKTTDQPQKLSALEKERKEVEESNPWRRVYSENKGHLQQQDTMVSNMLWWKRLGFEMGSLHSHPYDWALVSDGSIMFFSVTCFELIESCYSCKTGGRVLPERCWLMHSHSRNFEFNKEEAGNTIK
eukprot:gb/GECG01015966.1/.p1 GENE.gb/GECG01015966.1/~~gb/GECG01015966.1/.p1  ORF type:complete len:431 (+),score=60.66 gb/GECG01015966.1/:1-1293(+)